MSPRILIPLVVAGTLLPIGGCTSTSPVLRGQTPDGPEIVGRLQPAGSRG